MLLWSQFPAGRCMEPPGVCPRESPQTALAGQAPRRDRRLHPARICGPRIGGKPWPGVLRFSIFGHDGRGGGGTFAFLIGFGIFLVWIEIRRLKRGASAIETELVRPPTFGGRYTTGPVSRSTSLEDTPCDSVRLPIIVRATASLPVVCQDMLPLELSGDLAALSGP